MSRFFYDCEFLEGGKTIDLISIGIVTDDGHQYYAINSEAPWNEIKQNDWLVRNVLSHLPIVGKGSLNQYLSASPYVHPRPTLSMVHIDKTNSQVKPHWVIANEVRDFISARDTNRENNELWAYYGAYDHVALCQLWGPMISIPDAVPMYTNELMQLWNQAGRPEQPEVGTEHHALADAKWNYELWKTCTASAQEAK